jgi:hypothetical protein
MAHHFIKKQHFLRPTQLLFLVCAFCLFLLSGCKHETNYFDYVSELRNNIFIADTEDLHIRIYSVVKEYPYATDGIAHEKTARTEVYLLAPDGAQNYTITLYIEDNEYGGELAYDNVKGEYFLSFTLDCAHLQEIACNLSYGETQIQFTASSVLQEDTLTPQNILLNVQQYSPDIFQDMSDKYGFCGEIYLRLLYEDAPYYYVGIFNRKGEITAFLVNATSGKVLAQRKP